MHLSTLIGQGVTGRMLKKGRSTIFPLLLGAILVNLTACGNHSPTTTPELTSTNTAGASSQSTVPAAKSTAPQNSQAATDHSAPQKGGQVVETGKYHMEFVPVPETNGIHLDFFLLTGDDHRAIANARVTAQVQLPDGSQQTLPMAYDAPGKHYFAFLPSQAKGTYKVVVLTDISGEKVNGRFSFTH